MIHKIQQISLILFAFIFIFSCKKDSDSTSNTTATSDKVLIFNQSAITLESGEKFLLTASFVKKDGSISGATGLSWSVSNASAASISSSGELTGIAEGAGFVTASFTEGGKTNSSKIPYSIKKASEKNKSNQTSITGLVVAPAAILWSDESALETLQLELVYFGIGTIGSESFVSSNNDVASVSSTGLVTLKKAGEAVITVNASAGGKSYSQQIPVLIIGAPAIELPIYRIEVTPGIKKSFMDKTIQYSAKAFNSSGAEVTGKTIVWSIEDTEPDTLENGTLEYAATVSASGLVTTKQPRPIKVKATVDGVSGIADLIIYPDAYYTLPISDYLFSIIGSATKTLTPSYFVFNSNFEAESKPLPSNTQWKTLKDFVSSSFGIINGKLEGTNESKTYSAPLDQFGVQQTGIDLVFIGLLDDKKVVPAVSTVTVGF